MPFADAPYTKGTKAGVCLSFLLVAVSVRAELPEPDAVVYGLVTGIDPAANEEALGVSVVVERSGRSSMTVPARLHSTEARRYYAASVPMETTIGAPGPARHAARSGDRLVRILVSDAQVVLAAPIILEPGTVVEGPEISGTGDPPPPAEFVRSDCDSNRMMEITDAVSLLGYLFLGGGEPGCLDACDSNDDGQADISDASFLLAHLFLGGPQPAEPFLQCGPDPTDDSLTCANSNCT